MTRFFLTLFALLLMIPTAHAGKVKRAFHGLQCYQQADESWERIEEGPGLAALYVVPKRHRFLGKADKVMTITDMEGRMLQIGLIVSQGDMQYRHAERAWKWLAEEYGDPEEHAQMTPSGIRAFWRWPMDSGVAIFMVPLDTGEGFAVNFACPPIQ